MGVQRPFVYVNMAMTADGKITSATREYPTFTSPHDKRTMDRLRAEADAVLIGAGTLRADDPPLGVRDAGMKEYRRSLGKPDGLLHVVVSSSLDLDPSCRFFHDDSAAGKIVATVEEAPEELVRPLAGLAEVWRVGHGRVDLPGLFRRLRETGVERLLVEGGGDLNWAVAREGLLDEIYVTVAPSLLGGADAPTLLEGTGFAMNDRLRLRLLEVNRQEDEIFLRYAVAR
jgi:2,5-diamino-6-(ribosylamino)-4(3H)-pyrimidinone 5'-phosphate reductase